MRQVFKGLAVALCFCIASSVRAEGNGQTTYLASTEDQNLRVFVSEQYVRSAFSKFCDSIEGEICDEFERYNVHIDLSNDRPVTLWFLLMRPSAEGTSGAHLAHEFGCEFLSEGLNCGSTRQSLPH